jgi:crotonobetaine/carnitine-CoA ligase
MPMFHVGGCFIVYAMMLRGGSITVASGFSTSNFWDMARKTESTIVFLLGAMATFLLKAPVHGDDKNHPIRAVYIVPMSEEALTFADRFGVEVYTLFNMTEISTPISSEIYPDKVGFCGRPRDGYQVRIVDEHDIEVPVSGSIGRSVAKRLVSYR